MAYAIARDDGCVATKVLAKVADVGRKTASNVLKGLAERGILAWHGKSSNDPSQYYTVQ